MKMTSRPAREMGGKNYKTGTHLTKVATMSSSVADPSANDDDQGSVMSEAMAEDPRIGSAAQAAAAAEVSAMEGPSRRSETRAGEEALMGAAAAEDGVAGFEVTDDIGELIMQRFLQFLGDL